LSDGEANEKPVVREGFQATGIYAPSPNSGHLRQGEILSDVVQARLRLDSIGPVKEPIVDYPMHPYAVVLNQDCDLQWDFADRQSGGGTLPNILFCEMMPVDEFYKRLTEGSDIRRRIKNNKDERYQVLEAVPPEEDVLGLGMPDMGIDFKRYFTILTDEVYLRLESEIKRRALLLPLYAQHLTSRFCYFQSRIPVPREHRISK
jgi:hypothetical protein